VSDDLPPPRLAVLDAIGRCGFPAMLATPAGVMPAIIVWVDHPDDRALHLLPRALGGHLLLEMRDHHGEPTPAFWLGVGRGAVLASHALVRWSASAPDRATDVGSTRLGANAPVIWGAFEELCEALLRPGREERTGERHATRAEVAAAGEILARQVDAALPIASHIAGGLALALGGAIRDAERTSPAYLLPTRAERSAWVEAYLTRLWSPT
jgi:hypothetical protein